MAGEQTAWLLAWLQCWHIIRQPGTGTDFGCGWGPIFGYLDCFISGQRLFPIILEQYGEK